MRVSMKVAVGGALVLAGLVAAIAGADGPSVGWQRNAAYGQRPHTPAGRIQASRVESRAAAARRVAGPSSDPSSFQRSGDLMAWGSEVGSSRQQVTLIDPNNRVMAVYHIDQTTGQITLKSVRNVGGDLRMDEFNGVSPSPREIRSLLEQR